MASTQRTKEGSINKIEDELRRKHLAQKQPFDKLVILDFEAATDASRKIWEVIEWPALVFDMETLTVTHQFHRFVRPKHHKVLHPECTRITGVEQAWVDDAAPFFETLQQFHQWLVDECRVIDGAQFSGPKRGSTADSLRSGSRESQVSVAFASCGDYDFGSQMMLQCEREGIIAPAYLSQWINIKAIFASRFKRKQVGMDGMLRALKLELIGHHHSGIDDTWNLARLVAKMVGQHQCVFDITTTAQDMVDRRNRIGSVRQQTSSNNSRGSRGSRGSSVPRSNNRRSGRGRGRRSSGRVQH